MKITKEQFLKLYEQGLKDTEISKISGDDANSIGQFRRNLGLKPNGRIVMSDEQFFDLYNQGLTDLQISQKSGTSESSVRRRRKKFNLPINKSISDARNKLNTSFLDLYKKGYTDVQIAKELNIASTTVNNYRLKLKLPAIGKPKFNKKQLLELLESKKSDEDIASIMNYSVRTIKRYRQQLGYIKINKRPINHIFTDIEFQVLLGSLLGDGCISKKYYKNGGCTLKISHCIAQKEYLEYKHSLLKDIVYPIKCYTEKDSRLKSGENTEYMFYTKSILELVQFRNNWYIPDKHIYKPDVYKLSSLGLAIWYMDDGFKNNPYGGCTLCTNSFNIEDLNILIDVLQTNFDLHATIIPSNNCLYIHSNEFSKFVNIIKPYIIPCMEYKIQSRYKTPLNKENPNKDNHVLNL